DFTGVPVAELKHHFQIKAAETIVSTTTILGTADEVLRRLRQSGYKMAIATTKIRPHVDGIIKRFGWQDLFDAAVGGNEVAKVKPDPEAMLLALERMQAEPEDTMVVGDTENDVLAARAVPMQVTAISSPYNGDEKLKASAPDYFIHSLEELEVLLAKLDASEAPDA
ncbi:MAG: HAD family hydrolase, partial [Candidatus Zixiibacteriota bacterium]